MPCRSLDFEKLVGLVFYLKFLCMIARASTCLSNEDVFATPHISLDFKKLAGLVFYLNFLYMNTKSKYMLVK